MEAPKKKALHKKGLLEDEEASEFAKNSPSLMKLKDLKDKMVKELEYVPLDRCSSSRLRAGL